MKLFFYICYGYSLCFFDAEQPGMGQPMHGIGTPCEEPKTRRNSRPEEYRAPMVGDTVRVNSADGKPIWIELQSIEMHQ
jgi:hypothetical protein